MDLGRWDGGNWGVDAKQAVGKRLEIWLRAKNMTAADLCGIIDCAENEWSQFKKGKRLITLYVANELVMHFGLTLDWIYRNVASSEVPAELLAKMKEIRDADAAAAAPTSRATKLPKKKIHKS
jgi:transcriptional regulator with XRE-family HTH domain